MLRKSNSLISFECCVQGALVCLVFVLMCHWGKRPRTYSSKYLDYYTRPSSLNGHYTCDVKCQRWWRTFYSKRLIVSLFEYSKRLCKKLSILQTEPHRLLWRSKWLVILYFLKLFLVKLRLYSFNIMTFSTFKFLFWNNSQKSPNSFSLQCGPNTPSHWNIILANLVLYCSG